MVEAWAAVRKFYGAGRGEIPAGEKWGCGPLKLSFCRGGGHQELQTMGRTD